MASRSFKPASFLTQQPTKRSPRPSFTRSSSASSIVSTKSEDSFISTLRNLTTTESTSASNRNSTGSLVSTGGASPRCHTPVNDPSLPRQAIDDTPGRKRSQPIAIELPSRNHPVYTPLSARGDLPGGYFPNHETQPKPYKSHPFSKHHQETHDQMQRHIEQLSPPPPFSMSNTSSAMASPSDPTPRAAPSLLSPAYQASFPGPEVLTMPMGKYHPANYEAQVPPKAAPTSAPTLPLANISLPPSIPDRKKKSQAGHQRHGSDVKRKLQEYQIGVAKNAQMLASAHRGSGGSKPISPRLAPLGSPGPITPFELEESAQAGYVVAGARAATENLIGHGLERDRDRELVGRMIREEEKRRVLGGKEGSQSPVLRV